MTRLSVIVVSYNTADLLPRCLESILAQTTKDDEVVVVDNASTDDSAELVRRGYPGVRLIASEENLGFGAGNNRGLAATTGEYAVLLNPDSELEPGSLDGLHRFMESHSKVAVAGGRLRYGDGGFQHASFRFPTLWQVALDLFPINWRLSESALNGRYPREWDERAFEIDHPLGALMCARRAAIEQVGGFDERFFMYAEEVDWCLRFKRAGWQIWHCPDAVAIHHGGRSTRQRASAMFVQLHRSRYRLFEKHYPPWFSAAARLIVRAGMLRRLVAEWWSGQRLPPDERRARLAPLIDVMRL